MKKLTPFIAALTATVFFVGCAGGGSGVRFSDLFDDSAAAEGTGIQFSGLVRAVVILATHDATPRQRQVAEQNGRRIVAKLQAQAAAEEKAPVSKKKPRRKKPVAYAPPPPPKTATTRKSAPKAAPASAPEPEFAPEPAPQPKPRKKLPRIIAITTEKDANTDKKAAKAIMLFDTHAQEIIGNKVYDIESEPRVGDEVRFETHSTSYIGASL